MSFSQCLVDERTSVLGWRRLFAPFIIALLYLAFIAATFGLSTMLGLAGIASADLSSFVYGFVPAVLGLALGLVSFRQVSGRLLRVDGHSRMHSTVCR